MVWRPRQSNWVMPSRQARRQVRTCRNAPIPCLQRSRRAVRICGVSFYVGKIDVSKIMGFADDPGWTTYPEAKDGQNRCSPQTHDPEDPAGA